MPPASRGWPPKSLARRPTNEDPSDHHLPGHVVPSRTPSPTERRRRAAGPDTAPGPPPGPGDQVRHAGPVMHHPQLRRPGPPRARQPSTDQPDRQLVVSGPRHPGRNPLLVPNPVWPRPDQRGSCPADGAGAFVEKATPPLASIATKSGSGGIEMTVAFLRTKP